MDYRASVFHLISFEFDTESVADPASGKRSVMIAVEIAEQCSERMALTDRKHTERGRRFEMDNLLQGHFLLDFLATYAKTKRFKKNGKDKGKYLSS
ncbi:hypothetical protein CEXT_202551 [Caerostris extrusa]|uniref:Uncharacterized protein n=1 Tax=Caerostris extrusa TaxID=172846 RepID=A0AAV4RU47_CAEEX|nr:hypothetical protein CEXT_202551 [Caerostris extrusa]